MFSNMKKSIWSLYSRLVPGPSWPDERFLLGEKTVDYLLEKKVGFCRFGDGEVSIMLGGGYGIRRPMQFWLGNCGTFWKQQN